MTEDDGAASLSTALKTQHRENQPPWHFLTRIAFRFTFCYLVLYCLYLADEVGDFVFYYASNGSVFPDGFMSPLWHSVVPWVGRRVLHLGSDITVFTNSSADTTYDYVLVLVEIAIAAVVTLIWSVLDRRRLNYRSLHQWLRLLVRAILAADLFVYGAGKAVPRQFGSFSLSRELRPVGELSPISLLWDFMAASKGYTIFSGLIEVSAGVLLLLPQVTTLGALVSLVAMTNVFALNMSYDVPIKLKSFHLILLSAFLLVPELPRFTKVFVLNRSVERVHYVSLSKRGWINRAGLILPAALGLSLLCFFLLFGYKSYRLSETQLADRSPFYGIWDVDEFALSGSPPKPLFTDKLQSQMHITPGRDHWERVIFESVNALVIQLPNGAFDQVNLRADSKSGSFLLTDSEDPKWECHLKFQKTEPSLLNMQGDVNGSPVRARLIREDDSRYSLTTRGFHWVSEHAFFR